jgi:hypothetical protein
MHAGNAGNNFTNTPCRCAARALGHACRKRSTLPRTMCMRIRGGAMTSPGVLETSGEGRPRKPRRAYNHTLLSRRTCIRCTSCLQKSPWPCVATSEAPSCCQGPCMQCTAQCASSCSSVSLRLQYEGCHCRQRARVLGSVSACAQRASASNAQHDVAAGSGSCSQRMRPCMLPLHELVPCMLPLHELVHAWLSQIKAAHAMDCQQTASREPSECNAVQVDCQRF